MVFFLPVFVCLYMFPYYQLVGCLLVKGSLIYTMILQSSVHTKLHWWICESTGSEKLKVSYSAAAESWPSTACPHISVQCLCPTFRPQPLFWQPESQHMQSTLMILTLMETPVGSRHSYAARACPWCDRCKETLEYHLFIDLTDILTGQAGSTLWSGHPTGHQSSGSVKKFNNVQI